MKILLVVPRFVSRTRQLYEVPIGLAYISSTLKQAGHEVHCLNLNLLDETPTEAVQRAIADLQPEICGSGTLAPYHSAAHEIFTAARAARPSIINLVGGGVFSGDPEMTAAAFDIDIGVMGEGEATVVDLVDALESGRDLKDVDGIAFKAPDGSLTFTPPRKAIKDLTTIPWPDYDGFGFEHLIGAHTAHDNNYFCLGEEQRSLAMVTSRSCPFSCSFCFHPTGRVFRERPMDDVCAELEHYIEHFGINAIRIQDEMFAVKTPRIIEFCERIKDYGIQWFVSLHASIVGDDFEDILGLMRDAGCVHVSWGLESMEPGVLRSMEKKVSKQQLESALSASYQARMGILGNFIFGDSAETLESANYTMDWWARHREHLVALSLLQVYPGSPLYQRAKGEGKIPINGTYFDDPFFNVAQIDDHAMKRLRERVTIFRETLITTAEVIAFEKNPDPDPDRGEHYHIEWRCPRCDHHNTFRRVYLDRPNEFQHLRLRCEDCRALPHVRNMARYGWDAPELDTLYDNAAALRTEGRINEAVAILTKLTEMEFSTSFPDRPGAVIRAHFDLGTILLLSELSKSRSGIERAVDHLGKALFWGAFEPSYHVAFAHALLVEGAYSAARLHCEQALSLLTPETQNLAEPIGAVMALAKAQEQAAGVPCYFT